jgi:hypothetical protein
VFPKPFKRLIPTFNRTVHFHHLIAHLSRWEYHTQCELGPSALRFECPSGLKSRAGIALLAPLLVSLIRSGLTTSMNTPLLGSSIPSGPCMV